MIYNQDFFFYILSVLTIIIIGFRLHIYLKEFFSSGHSLVVTLSILLHPFSIDMFLAPNFISGSLAFYFFLESLFFLKKEKYIMSLMLVILAAACNFAYSLFPIYIFLKNRKDLKKYYFPAALYFVLISNYLRQNELLTVHNPIVFLSYFSQNIFVPLTLSVFDYSLFPFSVSSIALFIALILLLLWCQQTDSRSKRFWPMLFLPVIGVIVHQWNGQYFFWDEIIFSPSNYLCITFALIVMFAIHIPKKIFVVYFVFMLLFSIDWALKWNPYSEVLKHSIVNLPSKYPETFQAKRVLAWQLLYEKQAIEGSELLQVLHKENPEDESLIKDLEIYKTLIK